MHVYIYIYIHTYIIYTVHFPFDLVMVITVVMMNSEAEEASPQSTGLQPYTGFGLRHGIRVGVSGPQVGNFERTAMLCDAT